MEAFDEALAALERRLAGEEPEEPLDPALASAVAALGGDGPLDLERAVALLSVGVRLLERRARLLLPPEPGTRAAPPGEEEGAPGSAEELAGRLSEYRSFREAAELLRRYEELQAGRFPGGGGDAAAAGTGLEGLTLEDLVRAFQRVWEQSRPAAPQEIPREAITVEACMDAVLARLQSEGEVEFTALFEGQTTRRQVVVTFLALLELVRLGRVRVRQERAFAAIFVSLRRNEP